ncbi:MAG: hypothetical protein ABI591_04995 [Kofleriaceae bacterium]
MRALIFLAFAACSPDIGSGLYLCGPEQQCPNGQACDGLTNACLSPASTVPFACDPMIVKADDTAATGTVIAANLSCVSPVATTEGCLAKGDNHNWYKFTAPSGCTAVEVEIKVSYPDAFEPLGLVLADATGTELATDTACKAQQGNTGDSVRCLTMTITPGQAYTVDVTPAGGLDCGGDCAFNRYTLNVQVATPN